mgnify:FL=1
MEEVVKMKWNNLVSYMKQKVPSQEYNNRKIFFPEDYLHNLIMKRLWTDSSRILEKTLAILERRDLPIYGLLVFSFYKRGLGATTCAS